MKHTKMHRSLQCLFVTVGLVAFASANAGPATNVGAGANEGCNVANVTTSYYWDASVDVGPIGAVDTAKVLGYANPLPATACIGPYDGNDLGQGKPSANNFGAAGDGLFNGADKTQTDVIFNDGAFIGDATGLEPIDLDGDGISESPGWIFIGEIGTGGTFTPHSFAERNDIIANDFFSLNRSADGLSATWRITPQTTIDNFLTELSADENSGFFDAFAINIKASSGWASYLFTAETLGLEDEVFTANVFNFEGTLDTGDFENNNGKQQQWSHISLWIHDPQPGETTEVPAPGILGLMGIGLLGFGWSARRRLAAGNKLA